jgi:hypothetical protein
VIEQRLLLKEGKDIMPVTVGSLLLGLGPDDSDPEPMDGIVRSGPYDDDDGGSGDDKLPQRKLPLMSPPFPSKELIRMLCSV